MLNYEWGTSCITDDDSPVFDGFHLDEKYGLPDWTAELFDDIAALMLPQPPKRKVPCGTGLFDFVRTHRSGI